MKLWSGRFRKRLHPEALAFSSSLGIDKRLYREDIDGSIAHAAMLAKQKIISRHDATAIRNALRRISHEIAQGRLHFSTSGVGGKRFVADDVHMAIENRLIEMIGPRGGKLHTARSRNDQIALDERLFLRQTIRTVIREIRRLQGALVAKAERYSGILMPGYTHLQRAQPILLAHHLLAYVSMLERDRERFADCLRRVSKSPLGAGALAGTSFPIDRRMTAASLSLQGVVINSIDAVSDRDIQLEFIAGCAITMMHLSRWAEELVLWSSQEFHFADVGDAFSTGSSIMPQKRNPDIAELIRGKTGRVYGDLMALLTVMKALPLAYNRDMQEDKEPLFDAADTLLSCLHMSSLMLRAVKFNEKRFESEIATDYLVATELADYLARKGLPFRKAHAIVGKIVETCSKRKISLNDLSMKDFQRFSPAFQRDVHNVLDARRSISLKQSLGSTSPTEVHAQIRVWKRALKRGT